MIKKVVFLVILAAFLFGPAVFGSETASEPGGHEMNVAQTFLWIAVILLVAKTASLVEKVGQPSVLGELVAGVILGNLVLIGVNIFDPIKTNEIIRFLAELGVVILLFQIGLESNVREIKKVGISALFVALIGVVVPFVLGAFVVGPWLLPGMHMNLYIFIGATLTATSVGITARVFRDLGMLQIKESQIILSAAVLDDVFGLIILAVVSALVTTGTISLISIALITGKALLFLVGAIFVGQLLAEQLGKLFSKIDTGTGMKFALALAFGLVFAYYAQVIGLAPIVGAFAAGLVLDPVHFRFFQKPAIAKEIEDQIGSIPEAERKGINKSLDNFSEKHVEDLIEPLSHFLVPIFFVITGMDVTLSALFHLPLLLVALGITVAAVIGKVLAGLAAGRGVNKWVVGFGMVPRGEVGLIFAAIGRSLGVINDEVFSILVIVVILTTLVTPPILAYLLKKNKHTIEATA
jgi:Kef-type K+ transport system membrane component KefB